MHCINSWEEASSVEGLWYSRSIWISLMSGDNVESLVKIGGNRGLAPRGTSMAIDVKECEINGDMKGRNVSSLSQFSDTRLGRR